MSETVKVGRPRTKNYHNLADWLLRTEKFKIQYLNLQNAYHFSRIVTYSFYVASIHRIEVVRLKKIKYMGEFLRKDTNAYPHKWFTGKEFTFDFKSHFPRIRVILEDGATRNVWLRCPDCRRPAILDNRLRVVYIPSDFPTSDGMLRVLKCYGGHVDWLVSDVENWINNFGNRKGEMEGSCI